MGGKRKFKPDSILIDPEAVKDKITMRVLANCDSRVRTISDPSRIKEEIKTFTPALFHLYKKRIYLTHQKGKFLKNCPGTKNYICCGYKILNIGDGCNYDCKFCALQAYVNKPFITIYTNFDDLEHELKEEFLNHPNKIYRIGTGELTDSLSLEEMNHFSENLVRIFKGYKNKFLELKTKSTNVESLLKIPASENIIVSFSLNSTRVAELLEDHAPPVIDRITAARRCQEHGYRVGFHFDPIIYYPGWAKDYEETVDMLFENIDPKGIPWISLGAFRFPLALKRIIQKRFPSSKFLSGEFIVGLDKKMRYFKPIRLELFERMNEMIKGFDPSVFVYLCMESPDIWEKAIRISVRNSGELSKMLDDKAVQMV